MGSGFLTLDEKCRSKPSPTGTVVTPPSNGSVFATIRSANPDFPRGPYHHCNSTTRPALAFIYTSSPGFKGRDSFTVSVRYDNGEVAQHRYTVIVR